LKSLRKGLKIKILKKQDIEAANIVLEEIIKPDVQLMGINFDKWFSERSLYENNKIEKSFRIFKKQGINLSKRWSAMV